MSPSPVSISVAVRRAVVIASLTLVGPSALLAQPAGDQT